jgi:hypothetical protein
MNSKKCFVLIVALTISLICLNTNLWGQETKDPNSEIKVLQEKIKQLESLVDAQQKTINRFEIYNERLKKENERLKNLCSQAGIDTSPQKDKKPSKVVDANFSTVSLEELFQFVNGPLTELQKKELYENNYKGKWIQLIGRVNRVNNAPYSHGKDVEGHYFMDFIYTLPPALGGSVYNRTILVTLEFDESQKQKLLSINKGNLVTYQGKLPDSYGKMDLVKNKNLRLTDGRIIYITP